MKKFKVGDRVVDVEDCMSDGKLEYNYRIDPPIGTVCAIDNDQFTI